MALIVVADDDELNRDILVKMLKALGYDQLLICNSGQEAWECVEREGTKIDLLLLDKMMPDMSGLDILEKLKEKGMDIPVVLQSADAYDKHISEDMAKGIKAYLAKPFDMDMLAQVVGKILPYSSA